MSENILYKSRYINTKEKNIEAYLSYLKQGGTDGIKLKNMDLDGYIEYIQKRTGAENRLRTEKGLNSQDVVNDLKKHKGIVWIPIISLKEKDSIRYGCTSKEEWDDRISCYIDEFCKAYSLARDNVEYIYCYHEKQLITSQEAQKQPHVHLCIFQKKQTNVNAIISKQKMNLLHDKIDKIFMKEHYKQLYEKRNKLSDEIKNIFKLVKENDIQKLEEIKLMMFDVTNGKGRNSYNHLEQIKKTLINIREKKSEGIELNDFEKKTILNHKMNNVDEAIRNIEMLQSKVNNYVFEILDRSEIKKLLKIGKKSV